MGMFSDLLNEHAPLPQEMVQDDTIGTALSKGWSSGLRGAGSQLQSVAGMAGELVGADEFAKNRYSQANALRQQAQDMAPQIQRWDQVNDMGTFGRYAAGVVGGSAPVSLAAMGAAALTGGGAIPGMLAAGAATAPFEIGDTIQKQMDSPEAMQQSLGDRALGALGGGGASALFQGVVPGIVGKQLMGHGAAAAAKQGWKGVIGKNILGDAALEGVAEGGGDVLKQYGANPNAPTDWASVKENAIGGAVGGGAMGTLGAGADMATRNVPMARNAIGTAFDAAQAKLAQGREAAGETLAKAGESDTWKFVEDIADTGSKMASGMWDAASELGRAVSPDIQAKGEQVAAWVKKTADEKTADVQSWVKEITASEDVPAELKKRFVAAAKATPSAANDMLMASIKFGVGATKKAKQAIDHVNNIKAAFTPTEEVVDQAEVLKNEQAGAEGQKLNDENKTSKAVAKAKELLASGVKLGTDGLTSIEEALNDVQNPTMRKAIDESHNVWKAAKKKATGLYDLAQKEYDARWPAEAEQGAKKSDDRSGTRKVLADVLVPWLRKNSPQTLDPEYAVGATKGDAGYRPAGVGLNELGGLFNKVMNHTYRHPDKPLPPSVKYALFNVFGDDTDDILSQMHTALGTTDAPFVKAHYESMAKIAEDRQQYNKFVTLVDEMRVNKGADPRKVATELMTWATLDDGQTKNALPDETANAKTKLDAIRINEILQREFGSNALTVLNALEHETARQRDNYGAPVETRPVDAYDTPVEDSEVGGEDWAPPANELGTEQVRYGRGVRKDTKNEAVMKPSLFEFRKAREAQTEGRDTTKDLYQGRNYGQKAIELAERTHNGGEKKRWTVEWKSEHELGVGKRKDHGFVVASRSTTTDSLSKEDYEDLKFDTQRYGGDKQYKFRLELPAKINSDGEEVKKRSIDATKIERVGKRNMVRHGKERTVSGMAARNQELMHGVSQLMVEYPTIRDKDGNITKQGFEIPDDTIVRYVDGKPVTFGEVKDLGSTTEESADSRRELELKSQITAAERVMYKEINKVLGPNASVEEIAATEQDPKWREWAGLTKLDAKLAAVRKRLEDRSDQAYGRDVDNGRAEDIEMAQDYDKSGNIHELERKAGQGYNNEHMVKVNLDETPRYTPVRSNSKIGEDKKGFEGNLGHRIIQAAEDKANELIARGDTRAYDFDNAGYAATKGAIPENSTKFREGKAVDADGNVLNDEGETVPFKSTKRKVGFELTPRNKYTPKDQKKADKATAYIGIGSADSATDAYGEDAARQGVPVNGVVEWAVNMDLKTGTGKQQIVERMVEVEENGVKKQVLRKFKERVPDRTDQPSTTPARQVGYTSKDVVFVSAEGLRGTVKSQTYDDGAHDITPKQFTAQMRATGKTAVALAESLKKRGYVREGDVWKAPSTGTWTNDGEVKSGRMNPDFSELQRAMNAGATLITDIPLHRKTDFNLGERQVAEYLEDNGYTEGAPGRWIPGLDFREQAYGAAMNVDQANELSAFSLGHMMKDLVDYVAAKQAEARKTGQKPEGMPSREAMMRLSAAAAPKVPGHTIESLIWPVVSRYMPDYALKMADGPEVPYINKRTAGGDGGKTAPPAPRRPVPPSAQRQPSDPSRRAEPVEPDNLPMRTKADLPTSPRRAPSPKAVAAKKAALVEAASSSDPALLDEIRSSTDAASLVRSATALLESRIGDRVDLAHNEFADLLRAARADIVKAMTGAKVKNKAELRTAPAVSAFIDAVVEGRLKGNKDAIAALNSYVNSENQFFGLKEMPELDKQLATMLNKTRVSSLQDYMLAIAKAPGIPGPMRSIALAVASVSPEATVVKGPLESMGLYDPMAHQITINKELGQRLTTVMMHEGVHAATMKALVNNPALTDAVRDLMDHVVEHDKRLLNAYGLTDTAEFLAEGLSNPAFQKQLMMIPASTKVKGYLGQALENAWDGFVELVRRALALKPNDNSALSQMLQLSARALKETSLSADKTMTVEQMNSFAARPVVSPSEYAATLRGIEKAIGEGERIDSLIRKAHANGGVSVGTATEAEFMLTKIKRGEEHARNAARVSDAVMERLEDGLNERSEFPSKLDDTLDELQVRLGELVRGNEDVAYGLQRQSAQAAGAVPNTNADQFVEAREYLDRAVPWVRTQLADLMHAGDYTETANLIRLSKLALNPQSTAYHESLHAFFADLRKHGHTDVVTVLQNLADSPSVRMQMRDFFSNELAVLRQINSDPEERVAVMYQMWALGKLKVGPKAQGVFERIKRFIAKLLGHWTAEEHALHIMDYLNSGDYADNRTDVNVVHKAMMAGGLDQTWAQAKQLTKPLVNMAYSVLGAGSENLRDTGNSALIALADLVKKRYTDEGTDAGYIPASREAYTGYANKLGALAEKADKYTLNAALHALQNGIPAVSPASEKLRVGVRALLDEMYDYLVKAGVDVQDLGVGKDYFPRHWDADYLSRNKTAFMDMARGYPQWGDPEQTYHRLVGDMGAELPVVDRPGMAASKQRLLSFISDKDAAPFMEKDLIQIVNGYITQGTRRAEWARRFQDDNSGLKKLLSKARAEGATGRQITQAKRFVEGVNGTLGDDLNPKMRRLMGDVVVYQNVRLLPLAIFSSVVDPMGILVRGGGIKDAWNTLKRAVSEIPKGLRGDTRADEITRLAQDLDTITNASLQHALGTSYNQGMVGKTGQRINDTFFRLNLMEQWNTSVRVGATEAALGFLAKHAPGHNAHSARYMKELGIQAGDIKVVNGRTATTVADGLTPEQAARVKSAVNQWVDGAHLRPDAAESAIWMNDPHFMLISHLKRFVFAFHHTIIKRVIHEAKHGNYAPAVALTSYIPIMLASDMLKGVLQGGGDTPEWKKNWTATDYLMNATERAGLFGVGQFGIEALHGNWGALTGPTVEQLTEAVEVMGGRKSMKSFVTHAMPANALYSTWAKEGKNDTFDNPE